MVKGDLFHLPDSLVEGVFHFYWLGVALFVGTNLYFTIVHRTLNLSKWLIFFSVLVVWYVSRVLLFDFYVGMTLYFSTHAIAYYTLVTQRNSFTNRLPVIKRNKFTQALFIYGSTVAASWVIVHGLRLNPISVWMMTVAPVTKSIILSLGITPLILHYYFDAFIWRRGPT